MVAKFKFRNSSPTTSKKEQAALRSREIGLQQVQRGQEGDKGVVVFGLKA